MKEKLRSAIKNVTGQKHYDKLRLLKGVIGNLAFPIRYRFMSIISQPKLSEIGRFYRTDKADVFHSYLHIYEKYFHDFKDKYISVLEIGIRNGASLRTWKSYFKNAKIYGIDIDPKCKHLEERQVKIEIGSQDDVDFLRNCFGKNTDFDIIIDDGSHINSMMIASFEYLFNNRLNSNGIYIIEDLRCSYQKLQTNCNILEIWPGMKYNDPYKDYDNNRKDMDKFFLEKIKNLDYQKGNILCIHFWSMVCVIIKA